MKFEMTDIGKYRMIQFGEYVSMHTTTSMSKEMEEQNLYMNLDNYRANMDEETAIETFARACGAKKIPDFVGYKFDGVYKDKTYKVTLPMRHGKGEYQRLDIGFWKTKDGEQYYSVMQGDRPDGTIRLIGDESPHDFLERFIGEVIAHNAFHKYEEKVYSKLFPFMSYNIRENFNFLPALVLIDLPHPSMLNDEIRRSIKTNAK